MSIIQLTGESEIASNGLLEILSHGIKLSMVSALEISFFS